MVVGLVGSGLAQTRSNEPSRAWWGWARVASPSRHVIVRSHAGIVVAAMLSMTIVAAVLYSILTAALLPALAFLIFGALGQLDQGRFVSFSISITYL